jgi:sulfur dioxygenase
MAEIIFRQFFEKESSTYTYLLADPASKEAVLIDPVIETVDRDLEIIDQMGLKLLYVLDTHIHADHITASGEIRRRAGARSVVGADTGADCADVHLKDGDELVFGAHKIRALATPGHTSGCMSYVIGNRVFTGDALLVRGTGRTDFQGGSAEKLFQSITTKLFTLPPDTQVYPAHDYKGLTCTTITEEKSFNPRVGGGRKLAEFVEIMHNLKLALPKRIHEAVPANLACGKVPDRIS